MQSSRKINAYAKLLAGKDLYFTFFLLLSLSACDHYVHVVAGKSFDDAEKARTYHQQNIERELSSVTPKPAPIAGSVIVVLPTREQLAQMVRRDAPADIPKDIIEGTVDRYEDTALMDAEIVRRSNIFSDVSILRAEKATPEMAPSGGFLIWTELTQQGPERFISAAGSSEFSTFEENRPVPAVERIQGWLSQIEQFVTRNRPAT